MQNRLIILAPAKLNIFLKILAKREDGYHEIRSGITFINLFDQIEIELNEGNKTTISYSGEFAPKYGKYDDCIIERVLNFLNIKKKFQFKINVIKNIPVQGGLGSASTNAAALIRALEKMNLIECRKPKYYVLLGADIPCFLFKRDCLVSGMGEKLIYQSFPQYFFLLVKPKFNNSTKKMYEQLGYKNKNTHQTYSFDYTRINEESIGNDFERIVMNESEEFKYIFDYLNNLDQVIFSRMTGSGSCCYAVFDKKECALKAMTLFKLKFPDLWVFVCENNTINN